MPFKPSENTTPDASPLECAKADSRDCPFCHGEGMATVYAPGYSSHAIGVAGNYQRHVLRTMATCRCALGQYMRAAMKDDVRRRTPDVEQIAQGRSEWLLDDPTEEPLADPSALADEASWRNLWRQIRESRITKPIP
jgi:hypothetical protein